MLIHTYEAHIPYRHRDFVEDLDGGRIGESFELSQKGEVESGELVLTDRERDSIGRLYDGDIRSADRHVGQFLALLDELGLRDRTLVAITSDHGEELGDQFESYIGGHGHSMRDNLLMVPLVIADPTRDFVVKEVGVQVRTLDLLPTIAELLGVDATEGIAGRSLVPLLNGEAGAHRLAMSGDNRRGAARIGLRDGRYTYIAVIEQQPSEGGSTGPMVARVQLYDLAADPGETENLAKKRPRLERKFARTLADWFNRLGGPGVDVKTDELDEEMRARLKALGYID
jgi:arylsulfatase A-like enzyme